MLDNQCKDCLPWSTHFWITHDSTTIWQQKKSVNATIDNKARKSIFFKVKIHFWGNVNWLRVNGHCFHFDNFISWRWSRNEIHLQRPLSIYMNRKSYHFWGSTITLSWPLRTMLNQPKKSSEGSNPTPPPFFDNAKILTAPVPVLQIHP